MSKEELASYQFQLGQVNEALEKDPENEELLKLSGDLKELITLYQTLVAQEEPKVAPNPIKKRPQPPPEPVQEKPKYIFEEPTKKTDTPSEVIVGETQVAKKQKKAHSFVKKEKKVSKNDRIANVICFGLMDRLNKPNGSLLLKDPRH